MGLDWKILEEACAAFRKMMPPSLVQSIALCRPKGETTQQHTTNKSSTQDRTMGNESKQG